MQQLEAKVLLLGWNYMILSTSKVISKLWLHISWREARNLKATFYGPEIAPTNSPLTSGFCIQVSSNCNCWGFGTRKKKIKRQNLFDIILWHMCSITETPHCRVTWSGEHHMGKWVKVLLNVYIHSFRLIFFALISCLPLPPLNVPVLCSPSSFSISHHPSCPTNSIIAARRKSPSRRRRSRTSPLRPASHRSTPTTTLWRPRPPPPPSQMALPFSPPLHWPGN